jgi:para-aminobenzoate synthetase component 1
VATVTGRLRAELGPVDLLRATFPGGSVTGAPKIRACQIIDQLEPTARAAYTGAIGWIGLDGDLTLSVTIRTMLAHAGQITFQAGGAITADSDPESEYQETLIKARAMARAIEAAQP